MRIGNIDSFLEENFIPNHLRYKKIVNKSGEVEYEKFIPLYAVVKLKLNSQEKQYITKCLKNKGIKVIGYADTIDFESDDYVYTRNYWGRGPKGISKEETMEKLELYHNTKDINVRNEIVVGNMSLVDFAIYNMTNGHAPYIHDLKQAGCIGLIKAVENYDVYKGAFSTFAMSYINGYIRKQLYQLNGMKSSEYYLYSVTSEIENEYGETVQNNPLLAEIIVDRLIAKGFISKKHREENIRRVLINNSTSLDEILDNDKEESIYHLGYEVEDSFLNDMYDKELMDLVKEKMSRLKERQRNILRMRYGFTGDEQKLREIADEYQVSLSAIDAAIQASFRNLVHEQDIKKLGYYLHGEI